MIVVCFLPAMYTFHMITRVPSSWKAIVFARSFASLKFAEVRLESMESMESVHLTFMSEEAGTRRETQRLTVLIRGSKLTDIGL